MVPLAGLCQATHRKDRAEMKQGHKTPAVGQDLPFMDYF